MALHMLTDNMTEEQAEWSLAVALTAMSDAALNGLSPRRSQTVIDHLATVASSEAVTPQLRVACDRLAYFWEDIQVQ